MCEERELKNIWLLHSDSNPWHKILYLSDGINYKDIISFFLAVLLPAAVNVRYVLCRDKLVSQALMDYQATKGLRDLLARMYVSLPVSFLVLVYALYMSLWHCLCPCVSPLCVSVETFAIV